MLIVIGTVPFCVRYWYSNFFKCSIEAYLYFFICRFTVSFLNIMFTVCSVWNAWGPQSAINLKSHPVVCQCSRCVIKVGSTEISSGSRHLIEEQNFSPKTNLQQSPTYTSEVLFLILHSLGFHLICNSINRFFNL